jgi:hypothetical protein
MIDDVFIAHRHPPMYLWLSISEMGTTFTSGMSMVHPASRHGRHGPARVVLSLSRCELR